MKLYCIIVCHMDWKIIDASLLQFSLTENLKPDRTLMIDNCWPLPGTDQFPWLRWINNYHGYEYFKTERNIGGHGGFNYGLSKLDLHDDDLVLGYDPDSWPTTLGWLTTMVEVMKADPTLDALSLMHEHIVYNRNWDIKTIAGERVAFTDNPEMYNITIWRASALKQGLQADSKYYGYVETAMKKLGIRHGYLYDVREDKHPIEHPEVYNQWKRRHADGSYPGNFDEFIKDQSDRLLSRHQ